MQSRSKVAFEGIEDVVVSRSRELKGFVPVCFVDTRRRWLQKSRNQLIHCQFHTNKYLSADQTVYPNIFDYLHESPPELSPLLS